MLEEMLDGYVIENKNAPWDKRFWVDIPMLGIKTFGNDHRARIFVSKQEADIVNNDIQFEYGIDTVVTRRSDLYPKDWWR